MLESFAEQLGTAIMNKDLVVYFDSASFHMWLHKRKSWSRYEEPVKFVLNKERLTGITVMGAISESFPDKALFVQNPHATNS